MNIQQVNTSAKNVQDIISWCLDVYHYLTSTEPDIIKSYTVATLPTASNYTNGIIIVSDETGGRTIATSDGTNWRRVSDGAIVS